MNDQMYLSESHPEEPSFEPVENKDDAIHKPLGGLWTSSLLDGINSRWLEWVRANSFYTDETRVYTLGVPHGVDVLTIDSISDLHDALDSYQREMEPAGSVQLQAKQFAPLDFEALAEDYDAMRLTRNGQAETRFSNPGLYGWDTECTVWFDWVFSDVTDHGPIHDHL